jgi:2,3-bisphosphoglycerate-independent phosphoglycerate mutase
VGEGLPFDDADVLCLAHLSSVSWQNGVPILTQGRKHMERDSVDLGTLYDAVSSYEAHGIRFRLHRTGRNDAILILSGRVSPYVSDSDPMIPGRQIALVHPLFNNPEPEKAEPTASALNAYLAWCHKVLDSHEINRLRRDRTRPEANFLTTQRSGRRVLQEPFEQRWGLCGMLFASGSVYAGLAHELGLDFIWAKDGRDPGKDLGERIRTALDDRSHDFVFVHTKAADEAAHTGDPSHKKTVIASLDRGLNELVKGVETGDDLLVAVTSDHSTPSVSTLIHSGEPVPVTLVGKNIRRDEVEAFDEVSSASGCLGLLRGQELMLTLLNCADRSSLLGHRLGRTERPYFPHTYPPFKIRDES